MNVKENKKPKAIEDNLEQLSVKQGMIIAGASMICTFTVVGLCLFGLSHI